MYVSGTFSVSVNPVISDDINVNVYLPRGNTIIIADALETDVHIDLVTQTAPAATPVAIRFD